MSPAVNCWKLAQDALTAAQHAEIKLAGPRASDFDRMALRAAIAHLERAVSELSCFAPVAGPLYPAAKKGTPRIQP